MIAGLRMFPTIVLLSVLPGRSYQDTHKERTTAINNSICWHKSNETPLIWLSVRTRKMIFWEESNRKLNLVIRGSKRS